MCGCVSHVCVYVCICMCASWMFMCYGPVDLCGHVDVLVRSSASPNHREQEHIWKEPQSKVETLKAGKHIKIGKRNRHGLRRILSHTSCTILAHVTAWFQVCMWPHFHDKISSYMNLQAQNDESLQVFPSLKHQNNSYLSHTEEKLI